MASNGCTHSPAQRAANGGLDHAEYCSDNENAFYPTTNRLAGRGRQPQRRASSSNISTTSQVFTNLSISDTSNSQGSTASPDRTVSMRSAGSMRSSVSPDRTITASPSPDRGGRPTSRGRTNVPAPPSGGALPRTSPAPTGRQPANAGQGPTLGYFPPQRRRRTSPPAQPSSTQMPPMGTFYPPRRTPMSTAERLAALNRASSTGTSANRPGQS